MKKIIALILAAVFLLCACGTPAPSSGESAGSPEPESSAAEQSRGDKEEGPSKRMLELNALMDGEYDDSLPAANLLLGRTYKISRATNETYTDSSNYKLTNGKTSAFFNTQDFVAWNGGDVNVDFDFGDVEHAIAVMDVGCLRVIDYAIGSPSYVEILASSDGKVYYSAGKQFLPKGVYTTEKTVFRFAFPKAITARYIRVAFGSIDSGFLFVDEIAGYEYREDGDIILYPEEPQRAKGYVYDFYGEALGKGDTAVSESDADYDTVQNLALLPGVAVTAQSFDPIAAGSTNTPAEGLASKLANGRFPTIATYDDPDWAIFNRGTGRHIIVDLGREMAISGYKTVFLEYPKVGVAAPPAAIISLSSDGETWVPVADFYNPDYFRTEAIEFMYGEADFGAEYRARYLRMSFQTDMGTYVGELEVIGRKNAAEAKEPVPMKDRFGRYTDDGGTGCENIVFATCSNVFGDADNPDYVITRDSAKYYLGYVSPEGEIKDDFFDSFAVCPRGDHTKHRDRNESTDRYIAELFDDEDRSIPALDKAKGDVNAALGRNDKLKLWISVTVPAEGDVFNGESVNSAESSFSCVKYQVDETLKRINAGNFQNIEFLGFYWSYECLRNEIDLGCAKLFNEYVHSLGLKSFWCPYYNAKWAWRCHECGFDITCMQPNYMFCETVGQERLKTTDTLARMYGMCVEMEIQELGSRDERNRYTDYLAAGIEYGYMEPLKVYYQGAFPGCYLWAAQSEDREVRRVYDLTYKYAKGTLTRADLEALAGDPDSFEGAELAVDPPVKKEYGLGDISGVTVLVKRSPTQGEYRIDYSGNVMYRPYKDFYGEDEIVLSVIAGGKSKDVVLKYVKR